MSAAAHPKAEAMRALLIALIKLALAPAAAPHGQWRADAEQEHNKLRGEMQRPELIDLDGLWSQAVSKAEADSAVTAQAQVSLTLPKACPLQRAALLSDVLEIDALAQAIRQSAATG